MSDLSKFFGINTEKPPGLENYPTVLTTAGLTKGGEIIMLANNLMKVMIYGSMIIAVINLLVSGIQFIGSSGNPETIKTASGRIWISLLGLVVAAGSLVIAGILGLILFGDATAIINPKIYGPS